MSTNTQNVVRSSKLYRDKSAKEDPQKLAEEFLKPGQTDQELDLTEQTCEDCDLQEDKTGPSAPENEPQQTESENPTETAEKKPVHGAAIRAYNKQVKKQNEDKLIVEFLPMVHKIVNQVITYLHPPLSIEDLVSAGTIGLVKAARDYDPNQDTEFKTYAYIRIRGSVIDELRSWSFAPSSLKKQLEAARKAFIIYKEETGKEPTDSQLAKKLNISVDKLYKIFENARARHFLSIHGINDESPALGDSLRAENIDAPGSNLEKEELIEQLTLAIQDLPDKLRKIIILYYHKELTMKEVASLMEITESRVSQLHAAALFKLSTKLRTWDESRA